MANSLTDFGAVTTRGGFPCLGISSGTVTTATYLMRVAVTRQASDLRFYYGNASVAQPLNPITIKASVADEEGIYYPIVFNGSRTVTLDSQAFILSDPVGLDIDAGHAIAIFTNVTVEQQGQIWPLNAYMDSHNGYQDGYIPGQDRTDGGVIPPAYPLFGFGPVTVLGTTAADNCPGVVILGDSIGLGMLDHFMGFIVRSLYGQFPVLQLSRGAEQAALFQLNNCDTRLPLTRYCKNAIVQFGLNDVNWGHSLTRIQNDLMSVWSRLQRRGLRVFQTTITPLNTLTSDKEAVRVQLNTWLRDTSSAGAVASSGTLTGIFEIADLAETARNSGQWKAGYSPDGMHPNPIGNQALSYGINTHLLQG